MPKERAFRQRLLCYISMGRTGMAFRDREVRAAGIENRHKYGKIRKNNTMYSPTTVSRQLRARLHHPHPSSETEKRPNKQNTAGKAHTRRVRRILRWWLNNSLFFMWTIRTGSGGELSSMELGLYVSFPLFFCFVLEVPHAPVTNTAEGSDSGVPDGKLFHFSLERVLCPTLSLPLQMANHSIDARMNWRLSRELTCDWLDSTGWRMS